MKLYELIWNKFISSQMSQAVIDQTTVTSECGGHFFKSTGSIIKFAGFRTVYLEAQAEKKKDKGEEEVSSKNTELPDIKEGEDLAVKKPLDKLEHWTSPLKI